MLRLLHISLAKLRSIDYCVGADMWVSFSIVSVGLARGWQWSVCVLCTLGEWRILMTDVVIIE